MKTLRSCVVAMAAMIIPMAAAQAYAQPGDYAKHSAVYAEFIANCKVAAGDTPSLRDEAAKRLEKMSAAERELQVEGCRAGVPKAQPQRQATNVPPALIMGAGAMVGRTIGHSFDRRRGYRPGGYRSFDDIAEDSLHVHTRGGRDYDIRRVHAGNRQCLPPRQLHRSNRCHAIPGGGINCELDCR